MSADEAKEYYGLILKTVNPFLVKTNYLIKQRCYDTLDEDSQRKVIIAGLFSSNCNCWALLKNHFYSNVMETEACLTKAWKILVKKRKNNSFHYYSWSYSSMLA